MRHELIPVLVSLEPPIIIHVICSTTPPTTVIHGPILVLSNGQSAILLAIITCSLATITSLESSL